MVAQPVSERSSRGLHPQRIGLVLAGGAARGAYEVGVVQYIDQQISKDVGWHAPLDVLCGTSVGAINVCALAAFADDPSQRAQRLVDVWSRLKLNEVLRFEGREIFSLFRSLAGRVRKEPEEQLAGGLVDVSPLADLLTQAIPFRRIDTNIRAGHLSAISVSATHVASGGTVTFVQRRRAGPLPWPQDDPHLQARAVRLRASHALASAALPVLFPAVRIEGAFFCDGGLRQNVPLSPARRLGADGLVVVNPRFEGGMKVAPHVARAREQSFPNPLFLLGKTLNALILDRIDNDIDRLERINAILDAGMRRYGPGFLDELNEELLAAGSRTLRPLRVVHIRPSRDLAALGAEYVASSDFKHTGMIGRMMRQLAARESTREADLLSFLLFDGEYAQRLIELGKHDAAAHHDELCELFTAMRSHPEAASR